MVFLVTNTDPHLVPYFQPTEIAFSGVLDIENIPLVPKNYTISFISVVLRVLARAIRW